eukprot:gnl/MRDRNA2_/MRDRNA2_79696_c0_seq1.p1 gnl/MRDRNA2_/MRDRNA2_79696_c0~~gnl/MRDRNA2_/MRDRNA2_79696_c0_seq1.p1  ORF type:complete len:342 (+),score=64.05 gnl/MRDRNA2_/MRDRNA2_79696_c0_seq1:92-1117(+)
MGVYTALKNMLKNTEPKANKKLRPAKTFIQHSSQHQFKNRDQTAIVFDWDDTLFPTTFLDNESAFKDYNPLDEERNANEEMRNALDKLEQCQAAAESMIRCAQNFGRVFIVTLSTPGLLKKRCETWYPRVWEMLQKYDIPIVSAMELHRAELKRQSSTASTGSMPDNSEFSASHWAWVKGRAIQQELDRFYSQYESQTWKNVISIGDSNFEKYGTLGAATAHIQKRLGHSESSDHEAYVQGWERFDNDPDWTESLEGVHEGHIFKVRAKLIKMIEDPSPADLAKQLSLLLDVFPSIAFLDGCLNFIFDNMNRETLERFCSELGISPDDMELEEYDAVEVGL